MGLIINAGPGDYAHLERRRESYNLHSADPTEDKCYIYGTPGHVEISREILAQVVDHFTTDQEAAIWLDLRGFQAERETERVRHDAKVEAGVSWGEDDR